MDQQTIPFQTDKYFSRSWQMLTRDKGWLKPVLLLTLGLLVPIVGFLALVGYAAEWARLTSWGVSSAPKQRNVDIMGCIASGARALVSSMCWTIPVALVVGLIRNMLFNGGDGGAFGWIFTLITFAAGMVGVVAALRATIYQKLGAGAQYSRIWDMVRSDPEGLARVAVIPIVGGIIAGLILSVALVAGTVASVPALGFLEGITDPSTLTTGQSVDILVSLLTAMGPMLAVAGILAGIVFVITELLLYNGVGLWMLQFNVPAWGGPDDPMPAKLAPVNTYYQATAAPVQYTQPPVAQPPVQQAPVQQAPVAQPAPQVQPLPQAQPIITPAPQEQPVAAEQPVAQPVAAEQPVAVEQPAAQPVVTEQPVAQPVVTEIPVTEPEAEAPAMRAAVAEPAPAETVTPLIVPQAEAVEEVPVVTIPVTEPEPEPAPAPAPAPEPEPAPAPAPEPAPAPAPAPTGDVCWVTASGHSYHTHRDCPRLARSKNLKEMGLQEAIDAGYDPCDTCTDQGGRA